MGKKIIYLDDAIDAIRALWDGAPTAQHVSAMFDCEDAIRALPSAQSEKPFKLPEIYVADGYDTVAGEDGNVGFGVYVPDENQIYVAGDVEGEIRARALFHEVCHWVQAMCGRPFDEDEANEFSDIVYDALPSAQPEPIKINIDDFNKEDWERLKKEWGNTPITVLSAQPEDICGECDAWNVYKNYVQPEIMRCKNCKHKPSGSGANHDISFPDEVCPCQCEDYWYSWMPKDDWFCGSWERRTDEQT